MAARKLVHVAAQMRYRHAVVRPVKPSLEHRPKALDSVGVDLAPDVLPHWMKKEQMVGVRISPELVRGLELIEDVEQSDRSTTVRRLLSQAIRQWKLEHYVRQYGDGKAVIREKP